MWKYSKLSTSYCNLSVGASTKQPDHLKFLFELNEDFSVIPTFGVVPAFSSLGAITSLDGWNVNPTKVNEMIA